MTSQNVRILRVNPHFPNDKETVKSAGGRLQLNTHTTYVCDFAWSGMVNSCMVYTELHSFMWHQPCQRSKCTTSVNIQKRAIKNYSLIKTRTTCERSESARERTTALYKNNHYQYHSWGAGIAQWLEHRTRDWKVAGSNPCWNGGRIFFSRVDFLCWLLFRYPFHPRVTAVARKKSRSFCQKCRWQVTAKHAYTLRMWILLNRASALVTTCP